MHMQAKQHSIANHLSSVARLLGMTEDNRVRITLEIRDNLLHFTSGLPDDPNHLWLAAFPNVNCFHKQDAQLAEGLRSQVKLTIDPKHGELDCDSLMALSRFNLPVGSTVLEVGANEEPIAHILTSNGHRVTGIDLRPPHNQKLPVDYLRLEGDFVQIAPALRNGSFDAVVSTSALEHFGLGTYRKYEKAIDADYDVKAVEFIWKLLKPGGLFFVTVPYGRHFVVNTPHWRVYDRTALQERLVQRFTVLEKVFFKSADAGVPDDGGHPVPLVREEDADQFEPNDHPHLTVFLLLQKGDAE